MFGQEYATPENDDSDRLGRILHIDGTIERGNRIEWWMYNPPKHKGGTCKCGICKRDMTGLKHCKWCYPNGGKAKELGAANFIIR